MSPGLVSGECVGFLSRGKVMTALAKPQAGEALGRAPSMSQHYLEALNLVERLHRQLLDVIKDELDRREEREINSVQALLLFNVGDQELTAGELRTRGHYLGSNVSYNLKKLVDSGYIHHERSEIDRRSVLVRLTGKGEYVRNVLRELFQRHLMSLGPVGNVSAENLEAVNTTLRRLERFWIDQVRFRL
jgi:DNA-binding MarR family transcriptional regulator